MALATPAVCAVDECGVLAIGRCASCGQAFCATHQAIPREGDAYVDWCVPCHSSWEAKSQQIEPKSNRRYGPAFFAQGLASQALRSSDVPLVQVYTTASEWVTTWYGRSREVSTVVPEGTAWIVGTFRWRYERRTGYGEPLKQEGDFTTVLLESRPRARSGQPNGVGLARVGDKPTDHGHYLLGTDDYDEMVTPWDQVAAAVHRLTGIDPK